MPGYSTSQKTGLLSRYETTQMAGVPVDNLAYTKGGVTTFAVID
jgi:hypothetical protein